MDDAEFLAELGELERFECAPKPRRPSMSDAPHASETRARQDTLGHLDQGLHVLPPGPGDAAPEHRLGAGRRLIDSEPRPQFNDGAPPKVSMTTRVPAIVAALVLLLGLGLGASGAALIFQARLMMLLR
jgi:hypothetical protein